MACLALVAALVATVTVRAIHPRTGFRDVVVIGDSITDQATDALHRRFDGSFDLTVSGIGGARADQRVPDAAGLAARHPNQVIIELGTNDVLQGTNSDQTLHSLTEIADAFSTARCIHLVDVSESMYLARSPSVDQMAASLNSRIKALGAQRGWDVIDWATIVEHYQESGEPDGPITVDTVHPTAVGQRLLLDAYDVALERC